MLFKIQKSPEHVQLNHSLPIIIEVLSLPDSQLPVCSCSVIQMYPWTIVSVKFHKYGQYYTKNRKKIHTCSCLKYEQI